MTQAYPLHWPDGWPRTAPAKRQNSSPFQVTVGKAIDDLFTELDRLGARDVVISSNLTLSHHGRPYAKQPKIDDPGIAVYFRLGDASMVMARDRFADWRDNIRSIGLAVNALRALERHGGGHMMRRAFQGFAALPRPAADWRRVLGVDVRAGRDEVKAAYHRLAMEAHPDRGGTESEMVALNGAMAAAEREFAASDAA